MKHKQILVFDTGDFYDWMRFLDSEDYLKLYRGLLPERFSQPTSWAASWARLLREGLETID